MYQSLIRRRRDQGFKIYKLKGNLGFKIYKLKGNLSWLRVLQTVCNLLFFYYYYFIIKDEFEFNDLEYLYVDFRIKSQQIGIRSRLNLNIQNHCFIKMKF